MWYFRSPLIAFGEDALSHLDQSICSRVFIVTDAMMLELGHLQRVIDRLQGYGAVCDFFAEVQPDPDVQTVQRCAARMRAFAPEWVIGLGGGSSLDAAKAAWLLYERPDVDLAAVTPFEHFGLRSRARFVTIPTTAGSGAEVTAAAVITDLEGARKMEVASFELIPDISVVDPWFSSQMSPRLTADTGIDALTHAVEGFTSTFANDFSDALCLHAARLVFDYLPRAYHLGADDPQAREKMANAATLAALGMGNSHIALAHAMGHSAGTVFGLPHGRATGLFLPYVVEFTANGGYGRYLELAHGLGLPAEDEAQAAARLAASLRDLLRRVEQPLSLQEAGISRPDFDLNLETLCDRMEMDSALATSRRFPYREDSLRLFECAYQGQPVDF
jgi:alcohol dehydrogenase class IV